MSDETQQLQLMVRHYENLDFGHWYVRITDDMKRINTLKTPSKKSGYALDLYSAYLQLSEILIINMKIATTREQDFLKNLFISNEGIKDFLKEITESRNFVEWFLTNYDFGIVEKSQIRNFKNKYKNHEALLKEVVKDYQQDFQFLNAYKHGYRVTSLTGEHVASINAGNGLAYKLGDYDTSYMFKYKAYDKSLGKSVVYESTIMLNLNRVLIKAMFITGVLENIKSMLAVAGKEGATIELQHFYFEDKTTWNKSNGSFRVNEKIII